MAGCQRGQGIVNVKAPLRLVKFLLLGNLHFFQDSNLPGMVQLVLSHAVQHKVEIIFLAGDALAKPRFRQGPDRFHQHIVGALRVGDGFAPRRFAEFWDEGEIRDTRGLRFLSA